MGIENKQTIFLVKVTGKGQKNFQYILENNSFTPANTTQKYCNEYLRTEIHNYWMKISMDSLNSRMEGTKKESMNQIIKKSKLLNQNNKQKTKTKT